MVIPLTTGRSKTFIIRGEKDVLVDTGIGMNIDKFLSLMEEKGVKPEDLSLIIITHGHSDHYALLPELRARIKAPVLCHKNAAESLKTGKSVPAISVSSIGSLLIKLFGMSEPEYPESPGPEIQIDGEYDLNEFGVDAKVIFTPGHTDCSISVITADGRAVIGDFLFDRPFSSKPNFTFIAKDFRQMQESFKKLFESGANIFYGAHARPYTRKQLEKLAASV